MPQVHGETCMAAKKVKTSHSLSWIDRFFDRVERLPLPPFLVYLLGYLVFVAVQHALLWTGDILPFGEFSKGILFTIPFWLFLQMIVFHYFQNAAEEALLKFRPALEIDQREFEKIRFSFVHFAARPTMIFSVITVLLGLLFLYSPVQIVTHDFTATPVQTALTTLLLLGSPFAFGFFYFVFRSLVWITRLYQRVKRINLFNLEPLYVLSRFTSKVGMLFILYLVLNYLTGDAWGTQQAGEAVTVFYLFFNGLIAILAFVVPLWGIHVRLGAEKERVSDENNRRLEDAFWGLQQRMDKGKLNDIAQFRNGISALMDFRAEIKKIPTWPWDSATLRTFVTALLVPMSVWIVQQVLLRTVVK